MGKAEFSVYWWDEDGSRHDELRFVEGKVAVDRAKSLSSCPSRDAIRRVIITDGDDCTCFEWEKGKGVVFPTKKDLVDDVQYYCRKDRCCAFC